MPGVEHINPYAQSGAKAPQVKAMFDNIAPAYDRMNSLMSLGLHRRWLRALRRRAAVLKPGRIADLATGTGDVALAMALDLPGSTICGIDLSDGMLEVARHKCAPVGDRIKFICADATACPLSDGSMDLVTIAYGIRNFADISAGLGEMHRILRPGGTLMVLELAEPRNPIVRLGYKIYSSLLIPAAGWVASGDRRAYAYLPKSIAACPSRGAMTALMEKAGFSPCSFETLTPGTCVLYTAEKKL